MPRISRKGSGPGLQAFKGAFAAVHNCTANNKRIMMSAVLLNICSGHIFGIR
jgi:hypothetical protein